MEGQPEISAASEIKPLAPTSADVRRIEELEWRTGQGWEVVRHGKVGPMECGGRGDSPPRRFAIHAPIEIRAIDFDSRFNGKAVSTLTLCHRTPYRYARVLAAASVTGQRRPVTSPSTRRGAG